MSGKASLHIDGDLARIEGDIDFSTVLALRDAGDKWLKAEAPQQCRLDLSRVDECNSAATALLLDWLRTAATLDKSLSIDNVPERLRALMRLAGIEDMLVNS